jgi:hypothetical protein
MSDESSESRGRWVPALTFTSPTTPQQRQRNFAFYERIRDGVPGLPMTRLELAKLRELVDCYKSIASPYHQFTRKEHAISDEYERESKRAVPKLLAYVDDLAKERDRAIAIGLEGCEHQEQLVADNARTRSRIIDERNKAQDAELRMRALLEKCERKLGYLLRDYPGDKETRGIIESIQKELTPMTKPDLSAIRARNEARTPGRWRAINGKGSATVQADECAVYINVRRYEGEYIDDSVERWQRDAQFIAHASEDIPALLARVEELEAETAKLRGLLKHPLVDEGLGALSSDYPPFDRDTEEAAELHRLREAIRAEGAV